MTLLNSLIFLSAFAFVFYGILCLSTNHMKAEFERYGLSRFRNLVGVLEVCGGLGLMLGFSYPILHLVSSAGLSLLMLLGLRARLKVGDPIASLLPAFILLIMNASIFIMSLGFGEG